jgi:hypothetical protein
MLHSFKMRSSTFRLGRCFHLFHFSVTCGFGSIDYHCRFFLSNGHTFLSQSMCGGDGNN